MVVYVIPVRRKGIPLQSRQFLLWWVLREEIGLFQFKDGDVSALST
jgi:hypothetical protein